MKTMSASSFKTNCLKVLDEVHAKHQTVIITKRGRPVVKLVAVNGMTDQIYAFLAGKDIVAGDVVSPAISAEEWVGLK
jgi:prevent-host-death family protein